MTRFEFNSVLVSIMLAFAAAELVTAWGRVLRHPRHFGFSVRYSLISAWLFFTLVVHWFGLWAYQDVPFDRPLHSLLVLLPALVLALAAHVLSPDLEGPPGQGLNHHYASVARRTLPLCGLVVLLSVAADALPGVTDAPPLQYALASALSLIAIGFTDRDALHTVVLGLNVLLVTFALVFSRI